MLPDIPLLAVLIAVITLLNLKALRRWFAKRTYAKIVLTISDKEESPSDSTLRSQEPQSELTIRKTKSRAGAP